MGPSLLPDLYSAGVTAGSFVPFGGISLGGGGTFGRFLLVLLDQDRNMAA